MPVAIDPLHGILPGAKTGPPARYGHPDPPAPLPTNTVMTGGPDEKG